MLMKNKYIHYLVLAGFLFAMGSCKKKLDVNTDNTNANTANSISGKDVFANALQNSVYVINAGTIPQFTNEWMGIWARTTSYSASGAQFQIESFVLNNNYGDNFWLPIYHNLADYNFVIANSSKGSVLPGAALTMKCLMFQDLVDIFGDVPYTQADDPSNVHPAYDKATAIYASLISQIDSAMTLINSSQSTADDASDVMFKGNKTNWLAFANTVKLRLLLRQVPNASSASAFQAEITKTASYGYLGAGTDAIINPGYADVVGAQSPFWTNYGLTPGGGSRTQNNVFYVANQTFVDYLKATADPRIGYFFTKVSDTTKYGSYAGNYLGDANNAKLTQYLSYIGPGVLQKPAMSGIIMTASEALFLQAEAAQRGLISGSYLTLFNSAVSESFRYLGVSNPTATASTYITSSTDDRVNPAVATDPIKTIIYQKWVANAEVDGLESWCDYRRTGYPDRTNPSVNSAANPNVIPKRVLYPQTEIDQNSANYKAQNQTQADIYTKIFWGL